MGIIETVKEAAELVQKLDNIELVRTILTLQQECYDLVFRNRELRQQVIEGEEKLRLQKQLEYRFDAYWFGDGSQESHGPLCSTCWDAERLTIHMKRLHNGYAACTKCNRTVRLHNDRFERPSPPIGPVHF